MEIFTGVTGPTGVVVFSSGGVWSTIFGVVFLVARLPWILRLIVFAFSRVCGVAPDAVNAAMILVANGFKGINNTSRVLMVWLSVFAFRVISLSALVALV